MASTKQRLPALTDEQFNDIIQHIEAGGTGSEAIRKLGYARSVLWNKIDESDSNRERYNHAREKQAEAWTDKIVEIAADSSEDAIETENGTIENREFVNRSKLKIDTIKWLMSKNHIKRFGDKITQEVTGANGGPLVVKWEDKD